MVDYPCGPLNTLLASHLAYTRTYEYLSILWLCVLCDLILNERRHINSIGWWI